MYVMNKVSVRANQLVATALGKFDESTVHTGQTGYEDEPDHRDSARLVELAQYVRLASVRDEVCFGINQDSARAHLALWLRVAGIAPPEAVAAPLALAAFSAWMAGERRVLKSTLMRGLSLAPDYRLFSLLWHAYEKGLSPAKWEEMHMQH